PTQPKITLRPYTTLFRSKYAPSASHYWVVKPKDDKAVTVLVRYAGPEHAPALLERLVGGAGGRPGRVLLFTTPLDRRTPPWNNRSAEHTSELQSQSNLVC